MATKKPVRRVPAAAPSPARTLMGNQDARKGDSTTRGDKVCVTFWCSPERRAAMKAYAAEHEMTVSRLIIEAVEHRMKED